MSANNMNPDRARILLSAMHAAPVVETRIRFDYETVKVHGISLDTWKKAVDSWETFFVVMCENNPFALTNLRVERTNETDELVIIHLFGPEAAIYSLAELMKNYQRQGMFMAPTREELMESFKNSTAGVYNPAGDA